MAQQRLFKGITPYLFVAPAVCVLAFTCLYPVIKGFELSFYDWSLGTPIESRKYIGWENFVWAWQDPALFNSIKVTLLFTAFAVTAELFLGLLIAFLLEKGIKGIVVLRTVFIIPIMIAPVVVGLLWRYLFDANFGLINYVVSLLGFEPKVWLGTPGLALPAVIITDIWQWTPFMFILFLAGLQSLPKDPVEAAQVDGATTWQIIRQVKLPLLAPVIWVAVILRIIDAFRSLEVMFIMTFGGPGRETEVLSLNIYKTAFMSQRLGLAAVNAIFLLAFILLLSMAFLIIARPALSKK
ncbi:MAG: sugar ABC transporter permease [Syntrophaceae bacterium]|jgi:multiple sugar transport system permease protein|nr:sugar ABC transporter permease [Syntrophaceae bacterium]